MNWMLPFVIALPFVLAILVVSTGRRNRVDRHARQLAAIERKLDLIMTHLDIHEPTPEALPEVLQYVLAGHKIQAIKAYREATGTGLAEAKRAVEELARARGLPL